MAKLAIFSDLHLHPFSAFAKVDENGFNTRLVDIANALGAVLDTAQKQECDAVLFSGDFFHTRKIDVETLSVAYKILSQYDIPIYGIPGNHDEADLYGEVNSISGLHGLTVVDEPQRMKIAGQIVGFAPYIGNRKKLMQAIEGLGETDINVLHTGVDGALMGGDIVYDDRESITQELLYKHAKLTICGHFHQPQLYRNDQPVWAPIDDSNVEFGGHEKAILIPGAPLQHDMGDQGSFRGMWIWEDGKLGFVHVESPTFRRLSPAVALVHGELENSYVEYLTNMTQEEAENELRMTGIGKKPPYRGVRVVPVPKKSAEVARSSISVTMSDQQLIEEYVKITKPTIDATVDMVPLGLDFMRKARDEAR